MNVKTFFYLFYFIILAFTGCSQVPKEAPALSMKIGGDIAEIQSSYRKIVHELFDVHREKRETYIKDVWAEQFLEQWVEDGRLLDIANGQVVWDERSGSFVQASGNAQARRLSSIVAWSEAAINQMEIKRMELISPLDQREAEVLAEIDASFDRLIAANGQISGLLMSLRSVQEMQDNMLNLAGLTDERDALNSRLVEISNWADESLEAVKKADKFVNKLQ